MSSKSWSPSSCRTGHPDHHDPADDGEQLDLRRILVTLMTRMDQPSVGNAYPSTDAILARLRPSADQP
jgi:hypothetical protein